MEIIPVSDISNTVLMLIKDCFSELSLVWLIILAVDTVVILVGILEILGLGLCLCLKGLDLRLFEGFFPTTSVISDFNGHLLYDIAVS